MMIYRYISLPVVVVLFWTYTTNAQKTDYGLHIFYYNWYGNPETDTVYHHWAHPILKKTPDDTDRGSFRGGDNIASNYYPQLGCYSSNDTDIVDKHMRQIHDAGIGVVIITWWGRGSYEDKSIALYMRIAAKYGIKVGFHIEPFKGRNAQTVSDAIHYIVDTYGQYPAFYRAAEYGNKPLMYVYDSYKTPAADWADILTKDGKHTIRGTKYDVVAIGLWVEQGDSSFFTQSGFDGFYTYFATDSFTYGSTKANWPTLAAWAKVHNKIFIPCAGPGYCDTRIRPWNATNTRDRQKGRYYDREFKAAIDTKPPIVGITSFNEWHEGTQIEPAVPKKYNGYTYIDYYPLVPTYYLDVTRFWATQHLKINK